METDSGLEKELDEAAFLTEIKDRGGLHRRTPVTMAIAEVAWKVLNAIKQDQTALQAFQLAPDQRNFLLAIVENLLTADDAFHDLLNIFMPCEKHPWQKIMATRMINTLLKAHVRAMADNETQKKKDKAKGKRTQSPPRQISKKRRTIAKLQSTTAK